MLLKTGPFLNLYTKNNETMLRKKIVYASLRWLSFDAARIFLSILMVSLCFSFRNKEFDEVRHVQLTSDMLGQERLSFPMGKNKGKSVRQNIGQEGGTITSSDGRVEITIPEGALENEIGIEVQPISNTNPAGNGLAYRINPHGIQFKKPVSISFSYAGENGKKKVPQLQGIAYQDDNGIWKSVSNGSVDSTAKRVTVYTNHFSDWSQFEAMKLMPENLTLAIDQAATIKAVQYFDDDDLLQPLSGQQGLEVPIGLPHDLPLSKVKAWRLSGVGSLKPLGLHADYKAPATLKGNLGTAAVSLELNTKHGLVLLIANITVINEGVTFRIDDGRWMHFTKKECGYDDTPSRIYAQDSMNASLMINWPEKVYPRHPWSTTTDGLSPGFVFHTNGNFTVYHSIRTVGEAAEEEASPGYLEFFHFPMSKNDFVSGSFLIEKGDKYNARGEKLAEAKIEGYFYVRTGKELPNKNAR